ncbi:hypothetical protein ABT373_08290 [Streptomyces sp. NPDC000070]|uniref:hypothetical protein n=1 Tax=Streptomyces sp. NPDC000070 TaxID=3154240 RepID=UPI00331E086B
MIGVEEEERSGPGERHATPAAAVTAVLTRAFGALPESARATAPLYVLCGGYSRFAAHRFTARCHDSRRLRPSDSIALEAAELIRPYTTAAGHRGDCYLLDVEDTAWAALSGALDHGPFVECRITVTAETLPVPGCLVSAAVRGVPA